VVGIGGAGLLSDLRPALTGKTGSQFLKLKWGGLRRLQRSEASNLGGMALTVDSFLATLVSIDLGQSTDAAP
jgi:hypothetical protein